MKVRAIMLLMLFVTCVLVAVERDYTYSQLSSNGFTMKWRTTTSNQLDVTLTGNSTGWLSVGFGQSGSQHLHANIIIGYVHNGLTSMQDNYGNTSTTHVSDVSLGGVDNITNKSGSESGSTTTLHFRIPLNSGDQYDKVMNIGSSYNIILARGANNQDNYTSMHSASYNGTIVIPQAQKPYELTNFTADYVSPGIGLLWTTSNEFNLTSYNLYRSNINDFTTATLITTVSATNTSSSHEYVYQDTLNIANGILYYYWLQTVENTNDLYLDGPIQCTVVGTNDNVLPAESIVYQNYPNPFNPDTHLLFSTNQRRNVGLSVYNVKGQLVASLYKGVLEAGLHSEFNWNGKNQTGETSASGIYYFVLRSENERHVKKMILLK